MEARPIIELARLRLGYTQAEVACKAGIARSHYFEIAHGRVEPKLSTARRLAAALSATVDELWPMDHSVDPAA